MKPLFRLFPRRKKPKKGPPSDAALIDSLNRYIATLEGAIAARDELLKELRGRLQKLLNTHCPSKEDIRETPVP